MCTIDFHGYFSKLEYEISRDGNSISLQLAGKKISEDLQQQEFVFHGYNLVMNGNMLHITFIVSRRLIFSQDVLS